MRAEPVTGPVAFHGEGPVWSAAWGGLRWVDLLAGDVLSLAPDGSAQRRHVGPRLTAMRPRREGGAVLALERGFALEDADGSVRELPEVLDEGLRFNDGGCDPDGRFWCGSMAYDQRAGAAAMHRLDPDGTVHHCFGDLTISNGLEWSPDGTKAYYTDTPTARVDVFDYGRDSGLSDRRPFAVLPEGAGWPDGLTVDAEGGVWVAVYGGACVRRYGPDGALDAVVEVSTPKPTACTFGGDDLDVLYITSTREDLPAGTEPLAGALFAVRSGVRGQPARIFAG